MLSDDVLAACGTSWPDLQKAISTWVASNPTHQYHSDVKEFVDAGFLRKDHSIKRIRNILVGMFSAKPWEVVVGAAIASLSIESSVAAGGLRDFLGAKVCHRLLGLGTS